MKILGQFFKKKQPISVEFCEKNLDRHLNEEAQKQLTKLRSQGKINIKEFECLSHCKRCKQTFYAVVEGQFISGTPSEVVQHIYDKSIK